MYYDFAVLVETKHKANSPKEEILTLTKGVIHRVEVEFPAGCRGQVNLQLFDREHQVWPTNTDEAFNGEGYTVPIDEHYKLTSEPYALKAVAWGVDCSYEHTITVRIGILPEEVLTPLVGLKQIFSSLFPVKRIKG